MPDIIMSNTNISFYAKVLKYVDDEFREVGVQCVALEGKNFYLGVERPRKYKWLGKKSKKLLHIWRSNNETKLNIELSINATDDDYELAVDMASFISNVVSFFDKLINEVVIYR